ncbi:uncharacterized protein LOC119864795 isoform X4 [Canis lupus familiaris]|uniref:uncharacterized protein LOC119864795 isoform X4 n=1 Tax=Canis lupus familiaris TaxID=9615 RepID=UPI0018F4CE54|nr:uncharacterized protein LOC119864795 isoform X4 [Canis lupus familiaris]
MQKEEALTQQQVTARRDTRWPAHPPPSLRRPRGWETSLPSIRVVSSSGQTEGHLPKGSTRKHVSSEGSHAPSFLDVFGLQHDAGGPGDPADLAKGQYRGPVPSGLSAVSPLDTPHPSRGGGICHTSLEADPPPRSGSRPLEPSEGHVCAWLQLRHPRGRPGTWARRELGLGEAPGHSEEGPPSLLRAGPGVCLLHLGGGGVQSHQQGIPPVRGSGAGACSP